MSLTDLVFLEKMLSLSALLILFKIVQNKDSVWVYKGRPGKNVSQPSDVGWRRKKPHIYWLLFPSEFPCWEKFSLHIIYFPWFLNPLTSFSIMKLDSERLRSRRIKSQMVHNLNSVSEHILLSSSCKPWSESTATRMDSSFTKWPHHPLSHKVWTLGSILDT